MGVIMVTKKLTVAERKLEAEWIVAQSILGELVTNNLSLDGYNSHKDDGLLGGRISWETWKRYYTENLDTMLGKLETAIEYSDFDGNIQTIPGRSLPEKEKILKDTNGRSMTNLCEDISNLLVDKDVLFFRPNSRKIIEIGNVKIKSTGDNLFTGFVEMEDKRFITLIEKYADVGEWRKSKFGETFNIDSLSPAKSAIVLSSHILEETLPQIQRIFSCPIPIIYNKKLTFPKNGYDERFSSWKNEDSVEISDKEMPLEKAKNIIDKIYSEFCFEKEQDRINAISSLLTPFLRGLFKDFNTITPAFFYLGNREGVGKDYCASIPGLVMDGSFQQDTPICDGSKPDGEELRKKITSAIRHGRKRMHFANNKGYLNSGILEKLITDPMWTDRILGKTEEINYPNELDISLSGNIPIRYSDDLERRTIFINLFYSQEDINGRNFKRSDLHGWIKENRDLILSALYSLVRNWIDNGKEKGSVAFSSFEHWAGICGGIMESAGYDSPCVRDSENKILSGDSDSDEIKELYALCYEKYPNQPIKKDYIISIIKEHGEIFSYVDFEKKSDQTRFSIKLRKYLGRIFNNVKMDIFDKNVRSVRQEFIFSKDGHLGQDGHVSPCVTYENKNNNTTIGKVSKVAEVSNQFKTLKHLKFMIIKGENAEELELENNKIYPINILGDNPEKILLTLEMDKSVEVIK